MFVFPLQTVFPLHIFLKNISTSIFEFFFTGIFAISRAVLSQCILVGSVRMYVCMLWLLLLFPTCWLCFACGWIGAAASKLVPIIYAGVRFPRGRVTPFFEPLAAPRGAVAFFVLVFFFFFGLSLMSSCASSDSSWLRWLASPRPSNPQGQEEICPGIQR